MKGHIMALLFDEFPHLESDMIIIRKMAESDVDALAQITYNDNVYRIIPPFLYKKSRGNLLAAVRNLGGRDFDKKKMIIAGIYLRNDPDRLVGLAEMFDYKKRTETVTIGYRLNEAYWHRGIATETVRLMKEYLCTDMDMKKLVAYVMPENVFSQRVLINNGFIKEDRTVLEKNWGGNELAELNVFSYDNK